MVNWSQKIKELRDKAFLTQEDLASILGVAFVTVNRWENGHCEPTMKAKRDLSKLFKKKNIRMED